MKRIYILSFVVLAACADAWAGGIARNIADGLSSIQSFTATTIETGLGDAPVERSVMFQKPGNIRVETTSAGAHQGELFVYDGDTLTLWYPQQLFGVRIHHVKSPSAAETLHHIERLTRTNLDAYTFALEDEHANVAGHRAMQWFVRPAKKAPFRMVHRVWNLEPSTLPAKMEFFHDGEPRRGSAAEAQRGGVDKSLWYSFAYNQITFDAPIAADAFAFTFPKNAVVFEWDLDAPGIGLVEAREEMNFNVVTPHWLPRGHEIAKIVRSPHCLPMILLSMDYDGSVLSLIESRASGLEATPLGLPIKIGEAPATLTFVGAFSILTWVKSGTLLTLTSNLDFPTLVAIAESVQ